MKAVKTLLVAGSLMMATSVALADGEAVYNSGCAACHASGVAGAPKVGDKDAWTARVAQDVETTYTNAIKGFQGESGVMPPKGGFMNISDDDIKLAVDYMLEASK
ncbi:MAG: c-type cytochrome [Arenicellales bacterium]